MAGVRPTIISRASARAAGLKRYFTGRPCKRGHFAYRFMANSQCSKCASERAKANPSAGLKRGRAWYARNAKKQRARGRHKRTKNIQHYRAYAVAYNSKNLPRLAVIARNRRARVRQNGGTHTLADIRALEKLQRGKCALCRVDLGDRYHVDHILAIARGGSNDRRNLQLLCAPCNHRKSARDQIDFMREQGMLL